MRTKGQSSPKKRKFSVYEIFWIYSSWLSKVGRLELETSCPIAGFMWCVYHRPQCAPSFRYIFMALEVVQHFTFG